MPSRDRNPLILARKKIPQVQLLSWGHQVHGLDNLAPDCVRIVHKVFDGRFRQLVIHGQMPQRRDICRKSITDLSMTIRRARPPLTPGIGSVRHFVLWPSGLWFAGRG